eukprot:c8126_g1_i1 orf=3-221(-)
MNAYLKEFSSFIFEMSNPLMQACKCSLLPKAPAHIIHAFQSYNLQSSQGAINGFSILHNPMNVQKKSPIIST